MPRSSGRPTKATNTPHTNTTLTATVRSTSSSRKRAHSPIPENDTPEPHDTSKNKKKKQVAMDITGEEGLEEDEDDDDEEVSCQSTSPSGTSSPIPVQRGVPAFLNKLYSMVDDSATDSLIRWSSDGASFIVERHEQFAKTILPRFYKHNTFASFVRQLNMYDFHKIPAVQQGVLFPETEREIWEFNHANFRRGRPDLLMLVTRKRKDKNTNDDHADTITLASLVKQITSIRTHQQSITQDLHALQEDNSIHWQESLAAREKHQRHQEVIEKILQFLTAVFSSEYNLLAATTAQMNGPFMLGKHNEYISLLDKERRNLAKQARGHSLEDIIPTALIKQAANLVGMSTMVEGHPSTLTTNDPPSTSHTEGVGEREEEKKLNSMGRCMPKNNSQNNGSTRLAQSISDILRLTYSIAQSDLGTTGSATDPSFSSSSSSTNQDSSTHPTGRNTTTGQQKEQQQRHPMMDHRDIETLKQTLDNATRSAESISNDIDGLQLDIESLAATIGLDPTQFSEQDFAGLDAQNVFTGGHTDMMANATRNDIIQLYQLAGGSHIRNRYDASQASKGKGVASSVATPTPPSIAGDPQQQQQGGDMGLNISSAPLMADASQAVPVGTTTTPIPTDSGIPPQPDIPLSSTLTQPQLPSAPLLPPTSTDISAAATTTAFPQVGTTPVTGVSQASIPLYQPLLNTGVSPLITTLLQAFGAAYSINNNSNNYNNTHPSASPMCGCSGTPQQQGSSSIAAADAAATSTSVSATTNINDAAAAAPGNNNDSGSTYIDVMDNDNGRSARIEPQNITSCTNNNDSITAGIIPPTPLLPPGLINPQMFQAFYQGIGLPQQPSQFPSTNNPGQPQQFIPIPVPIPVAVPIQQPITPLSSTATSQQIPSNTTATNLPTSTTTVPQPPPPGIPQPFPTSTVNPLIIPFINGTPYNTQQQQDENSSTINNNNPPPLSNYPPTDPSL